MAQELESSQEQRVLPQTDTGMSAFFKILASKIPSTPHPVSQGRGVYTTNPQVNPNIMCPKPSTSAIAGSTSKPSSSAPPVRESKQPDAATLAKLGIKVRDFAYESTLPPVKPVHLLPRQIQPGVRTLKRIRDGDVVEDVFYQPTAGSAEEGEGSSSKKSKLERTVTEPMLETGTRIPPTRARGFANLEEYDPAADSQLVVNSQQSASQPPPLYFESQESEPYIDTPFVTPNGSLRWPVPASQLDTAPEEAASPVSRLNTESTPRYHLRKRTVRQ